MTRKRTATGLAGILAIDKPAGMTSHDVVNAVRRITGERRVGHAGTLDPLATGLLLVCVGPATRLSDYLMAGTKVYEARICFGTATNTDDAEGEVVRTGALPPQVADEAFAADCLAGLCGELEQVPPAFSAIKKDGVKAYKAARKGEELVLEPRKVRLNEISLLAAGSNYWEVRLEVSKGFYVRSFARDLGEQLGTAAHLGALRRTGSGTVFIEDAVELKSLAADEPLPFIDPTLALGLPVVEIDAIQARNVQNGNNLTAASTLPHPNQLVSVVYDNKLVALYRGLRPQIVIPHGIETNCYTNAHGLKTL